MDATLSPEAQLLRFTPASRYEAGTVFTLLARSWEPIWSPELEDNLKGFDREVFENPTTVGACTLVTCLKGEPIGVASNDPRQGPELARIGYNCIVPEQQRKGYGTRQMQEVLRILRERSFRRVLVPTGEEAFYLPARRMYEACGFSEKGRSQGCVEYVLDLA